jgi:hypothetical protein
MMKYLLFDQTLYLPPAPFSRGLLAHLPFLPANSPIVHWLAATYHVDTNLRRHLSSPFQTSDFLI